MGNALCKILCPIVLENDEEGKNEIPLAVLDDAVNMILQPPVTGLDSLKVNRNGAVGEVDMLGVVSTKLRVLQHAVENGTLFAATISIGIW